MFSINSLSLSGSLSFSGYYDQFLNHISSSNTIFNLMDVTLNDVPGSILFLSQFSPENIDGLAHWYKSDSGVTTDSYGITQWNDLIGSSHASSSIDVRKPVLSDTLNGHPVINFNSGTIPNDQTTVDSLFFPVTLNQPNTIVIVYGNVGYIGDGNPATPGDGNDLYWVVLSTLGTELIQYDETNTNTYMKQSSSLTHSSRVNDNGFGVTMLEFDSISKFINNGQILASGSIGNVSATGFTLGGRPNDFRNGAFFDAVELMVFNKVLSTQEKSQLDNYFKNRYALSY